jgi:hypothetical protein
MVVLASANTTRVQRVRRERNKSREVFISISLLHGGSGGFNGDSATDGYCLWSEAEKDGDGLVSSPTVWDVISSPIGSDVISGTVMILMIVIG